MQQRLTTILTALLGTVLLAASNPTQAQNPGDNVIVEMNNAFKRADKARLAQLLPLSRGNPLEAWAAYWELKARLADAQPQEIQAFLARYAGTYQEDRLRNDWLLLLGQRRDWQRFSDAHPAYRMGDDREVACYATVVSLIETTPTGETVRRPADLDNDPARELVRRHWYAQRGAEDGCTLAADRLYAARRMTSLDIWRKARLAMEAGQGGAARAAVAIVAPDMLDQFKALNDSAVRYLTSRTAAVRDARRELVVLALVKLAASDPEQAASMLDSKWGSLLSAEENHWIWGVVGKQAALKLWPQAVDYFGRVAKDSDLSDDALAWKTRAALRAGRWKDVASAIDGMGPTAQKDPAWVYWRARALLADRPSDAQRDRAQQMFASIAGPGGFYEQLALEETGQRVSPPAQPQPLTAEERESMRRDAGLNRALYAIALGLRSEGVREWNYVIALHTPGGMTDRELLAAAAYACEREVWDRCINTSERTRAVADYAQRYPMPFRDAVVARARGVGLDPAYVYGLIRQESRFIMDARSGVGASGLMQVMPATARWTARKIGMANFEPSQITDRDTNITIGTAYLKLALDDFQGSMPLAAAAYNAGPGRPRSWRNGPPLEAAIWAENVPFTETRDYVKKVLANTTSYAAILSGQPQSLKARLGTVGPRDPNVAEPNRDLP